MKVSIFNCDDMGFVLYVIRFLRSYIIQETNYRKLAALDAYLNSPNMFGDAVRILSCRAIILSAANNLVFKRFHDEIVITINNNKKFAGLNAKLYDLCKLINYGTVSVPGYPIFTEAFNYVADNIEFLYFNYKEGFSF